MKQSNTIYQWFVVIWVGLLTAVFPTHPTFAHGGITADGSASDWANLGNGSCPSAPSANTGAILNVTHTDCGLGVNSTPAGNEWVWTDASGDERTDFSSPDTRVDITQFRITADSSNLYFLVRMNDITQATGDGAPQVQIAIDLDKTSGSGTNSLGGFADTNTVDASRWERLIITRFGSTNSNVTMYDAGFANNRAVGQAASSATNDLIEISVPWSEIGSGTLALRFTVATFRANGSDNTWDTGGSSISNALDAITTLAPNTWDEVSDQDIDHFFDLTIDTPTAVNLQTLTAQPAANTLTIIAIALVLLLGGITAVFHTKNKKGQHHASL